MYERTMRRVHGLRPDPGTWWLACPNQIARLEGSEGSACGWCGKVDFAEERWEGIVANDLSAFLYLVFAPRWLPQSGYTLAIDPQLFDVLGLEPLRSLFRELPIHALNGEAPSTMLLLVGPAQVTPAVPRDFGPSGWRCERCGTHIYGDQSNPNHPRSFIARSELRDEPFVFGAARGWLSLALPATHVRLLEDYAQTTDELKPLVPLEDDQLVAPEALPVIPELRLADYRPEDVSH